MWNCRQPAIYRTQLQVLKLVDKTPQQKKRKPQITQQKLRCLTFFTSTVQLVFLREQFVFEDTYYIVFRPSAYLTTLH